MKVTMKTFLMVMTATSSSVHAIYQRPNGFWFFGDGIESPSSDDTPAPVPPTLRLLEEEDNGPPEPTAIEVPPQQQQPGLQCPPNPRVMNLNGATGQPIPSAGAVDDGTLWNTIKEKCGNVDYHLKLVVTKDSGHLRGYGEPVIGNDESIDYEQCLSMVAHVAQDVGTSGIVKLVEVVPEQEKTKFWSTREIYDLKVTRKFSDIAKALESINVENDAQQSYLHAMVPKNCGTFILELGRLLNIPVDADIVTFVVSAMQSTFFTNDFKRSQAYKILSMEEWFGNTRRLGSTTNSRDSDSMIRRLFEYMLQQQYPEDLIHVDL